MRSQAFASVRAGAFARVLPCGCPRGIRKAVRMRWGEGASEAFKGVGTRSAHNRDLPGISDGSGLQGQVDL